MARDVRMRGFRERAPVAAAQAWIDALAIPARPEEVPGAAAAGRRLAETLVAPADLPPFARAAMDGWALRAAATYGAGPADPVAFGVVGVARAGHPFAGVVGAGEAVRIMTGAALPDGADAVLPAEEGREENGRLEALATLSPGRHVGAAGEDLRQGEVALAAGRWLRPQDVGLAAALGRERLCVQALPRIAVLVTGDELCAPGSRPGPGGILDANGPMLEALLRHDGAGPVVRRRVPDRRAALAEALATTPGDVVLVSGGSSVGEEDHAPGLVAEQGELVFHGLALRPAAPAGLGMAGGRPVFLLPGHPVSCLCAYDLLAGRWVRRWARGDPAWPYAAVQVRAARKMSSALGRLDYLRVRLTPAGAEPLMSRGAAILSSTTRADAFVLIPPESEGHAPGEAVTAYCYDPCAGGRSP